MTPAPLVRPLPATISTHRFEDRAPCVADGWQLGEHNIWGKHTNFELGTRVPLMFRIPDTPPQRVQTIVESVDLYPTLANLAGLPPPPDVDGSNLFAFLDSAHPPKTMDRSWEDELLHADDDMGGAGRPFLAISNEMGRAAFSEYPRCCHNLSTPWDDTTSCTRTPRTQFTAMGYSVRVDAWRYTVWLHWDAQRLVGDFSRPLIARELYAHPAGTADASFDATENANVVDEHQHVAAQLHQRVVHQWAHQLTPLVESR